MKSPTRPLIRYAAIVAIAASTVIDTGMASNTNRTNVLLIVADDLGYSDLGCYGGEIDTPNLDRLAAEGIRCSQFHVNPMCVVTRTSLMTGHTHCQSDNYRRSLPVARLMQQAGYATSITGKWHQPGNPLDAGFDSFYGFLQRPDRLVDRRDCRQAGNSARSPKSAAGGLDWYSSDAFTDDAIEQIEAARNQERPFFAYVAYNAPHSPLHAPRKNVEKYYERYRVGWDVLRKRALSTPEANGADRRTICDDRS